MMTHCVCLGCCPAEGRSILGLRTPSQSRLETRSVAALRVSSFLLVDILIIFTLPVLGALNAGSLTAGKAVFALMLLLCCAFEIQKNWPVEHGEREAQSHASTGF